MEAKEDLQLGSLLLLNAAILGRYGMFPRETELAD